RCRSTCVIVVLDCCHSGSFKGGDPTASLMGDGRFIVSSSAGAALSDDAGSVNEPSPFTKLLVDGLRSGIADANGDGFVSLNELYDYIAPRLRAQTRQPPLRSFDQAIGDPPIGKNPNPRPRTTPGPFDPTTLRISPGSIIIEDFIVGKRLPARIIDVETPGRF